ncbi:MAG: glucose-6-phosphate isomerase [Proteobacteria bacterium]|nr:glucose-6-phosphate isomerase [Pseudomonadota bacterium]
MAEKAMRRPLPELASYQALRSHAQEIEKRSLRDWFEQDPLRFETFSRELEQFLFDFSRNRICDKTVDRLLDLSSECEVKSWRDRMFSGEPINLTENLPVQHTALRDPDPASGEPGGLQSRTLERMGALAEEIHEQGFTDVVHLGTGGSQLGPRLVCDAFSDNAQAGLSMHFVANADAREINCVLKGREAGNTLFIIASKSFATAETLANAQAAKNWLLQNGIADPGIARHFVAVTSRPERASAWGIPESQMLPVWDSVGGRFSVWSAVGFGIVLYLGMPAFRQLLLGAREMDYHFRTASPKQNVPLLLALLGIWNQHFMGTVAQVVLPYDTRLRYLPGYLQQLEMESNGKCVDRGGRALDVPGSAMVFGDVGTNAQHGFFQYLHQGSHVVHCDFIGVVRAGHSNRSQHEMLLSNMIAQARALMHGQTLEEAQARAQTAYAEHRVFPGNRTSNTILLRELTPHSLGQLLALYEHKVFVEGIVLNVNSFDQPGVELGKNLAECLLESLRSRDSVQGLDPATRALLDYYRKHA